MSELVLNANELPESLFRLIPTARVRVKENEGIIQLLPINENNDCTVGIRGILAGEEIMSVDKFLERLRADAELES